MLSHEFAALAAQSYNRIPVSRTVLADFETPLSAYRKLATGRYSYLFESVQGGEKWGRYSIIGLPCDRIIRVYGNEVQCWRGDDLLHSETVADPLAWVDARQKSYRCAKVDGLPVFYGGLVGYFAYDSVRYVEPRLRDSSPPDTLGTPDILLMESSEVVVFDNLAGTLTLIVNADPALQDAFANAQQRLDELIATLREHTAPLPQVSLDDSAGAALEQSAHSHFTQETYRQVVERIKEYVLAGDVMQVVPSQRMSIPFEAEPLNLYRALRNLNPSPYLYYLNLDDFHIVGSSPEILARQENGKVTVRPIAGTRRRGYDDAEDAAFEAELLADPKEIAEHVMLIDLGRNDVGRIAKTGSVSLTDKMLVERYSHVMHMVSSVQGDLQDQMSAIDVLKATLPAGTLSGAPKIRAMQIIDEVEPVRRGVYGGAVGYIGWSGDMDTAIAIRTAVIKDKTLYVQAGGGVVADSIADLEWKETRNKARAMFRAAAMASGAISGEKQ